MQIFTTAAKLLSPLLFLAASTIHTSEAIKLRFQYGGEWVSVGDADLNGFVYSQAYDNFDNFGGAYQVTSGGYTSTQVCLVGNSDLPDPQVSFLITGQAAYGSDAGSQLTGWNFRDLLVHTMWQGVEQITNPTGWAVCVPKTTNECKFTNVCANDCSGGANDCTDQHWGHKLPSILRVNVYEDDDSLRPEFFQVELTNYGTSSGDKECGTAMDAFGIIAGLVPGIGSYVSATVSVACLL